MIGVQGNYRSCCKGNTSVVSQCTDKIGVAQQVAFSFQITEPSKTRLTGIFQELIDRFRNQLSVQSHVMDGPPKHLPRQVQFMYTTRNQLFKRFLIDSL